VLSWGDPAKNRVSPRNVLSLARQRGTRNWLLGSCIRSDIASFILNDRLVLVADLPLPMDPEQERNTTCSFEEFKLIYDSAEKVTDRRLAKNSQNYSISVGIILAIAVIANWSISNPPYRFSGFTLIAVISGMASVYAKLWLKQILDFKLLNTAKFEVLNEMAPYIEFPAKTNGEKSIVSYQPFKREWEIMSEMKALQNTRQYGFKALKSTSEELFVPNAFFVIFTATTSVSLVAILLNIQEFVEGWKTLLL
jgi:hypothetical protein